MELHTIHILDILGTVAFAISGVLAAMEVKLDLFGVLIIAFVTALGGGTLRDLLIGDLPVSWIGNIGYTLIVIVTVIIAIPFNRHLGSLKKTLLFFDSIGLGFFTIAGVQKGLAFGLHPGICIVLGTVTACFGGVTRDILLNNIPLIFRKEIYASACIVGASLYLLVVPVAPVRLAEGFSILLVVLIRLGAVRYDWQLPNIYRREKNKR